MKILLDNTVNFMLCNYRNTDWYKDEVNKNEAMANKLGYAKVSELKGNIVRFIKDFVVTGEDFSIAMCSATDTIDIALAAENVDIVGYKIL